MDLVEYSEICGTTEVRMNYLEDKSLQGQRANRKVVWISVTCCVRGLYTS